ncbi:MAG TPA: CapA family protein [Candidatus Eisenbacteria bacterium]|nr:CapA family protein [Candidatus Eisenbacteria bacterium]
MRRRAFLQRTAAAAAGLALARARALAAVTRADSLARAAAPDTVTQPRPLSPAVTLIAGGDVTLGANLQDHWDQQLALGRTPGAIAALYSAGVRPLLDQADVAIVNLEGPLTARGVRLPKNFNFRARAELVQILSAASIDAVTLANNHMMDWGRDGLEDTLEALDRAGIAAFGAGLDLDQARAPVTLVRQGVRVGFAGWYFQAPPDMLEPAEVYATADRPGVAGCYQDLGCMRRMLEDDLRRLVPTVDVAIAFFHWGHEGSTEVRDYQITLAHQAIDLGCRAVLGAHPHRLQAVELYRGAPIFYSLGNFIFGGNKDPKDKLSALARLWLARDGSVEADLVPIQTTRWPEAPFQPFPLEGEALSQALGTIAGLSRGLATIPQLAAIPLPPLPAAAPADSAR